jgi:hypothetical protein
MKESAVHTIPIDDADIAAGRALRAEFARFWSTEQGEPRAIYDRFIAATPRGTTPVRPKNAPSRVHAAYTRVLARLGRRGAADVSAPTWWRLRPAARWTHRASPRRVELSTSSVVRTQPVLPPQCIPLGQS